MTSENIKVLATGLRFPEGPIAMRDGSVLLVEIEGKALTRVGPDGAISRIEVGGGPNGAAIGPDGQCYICNNGGLKFVSEPEGVRPILQADDYQTGSIQRVDLATGRVTTLYSTFGNIRLRGPNDIVFDRHGGFYFTDLGKTRPNDIDRGMVYYARTDGSDLRPVAGPILTPNGIGLSPDQSRLYVAETQTARLWSWKITSPGEVEKKPFPSPHGGALVCGLPGFQMFDSLAVEASGNICVATLFESGITVIAPDGNVVEKVHIPDMYTTNICFGGDDLRTAFVTMSYTGKLAAVPWKRSGLALNFQA